MYQDPLVAEQLDAGAAFVREFDRYKPVKVAFWLKESAESCWYLYIASDKIDGSNFDLAYGEVIRLANQMNDPNFDPLRVKVVGTTDPIAPDVLEILSRYPGIKVAIRRQEVQLGRMIANEIYIYPNLALAAVP